MAQVLMIPFSSGPGLQTYPFSLQLARPKLPARSSRSAFGPSVGGLLVFHDIRASPASVASLRPDQPAELPDGAVLELEHVHLVEARHLLADVVRFR